MPLFRRPPLSWKRLRLSLGIAVAMAGGGIWAATRTGHAELARVTRAQYRMGTVLEIDAIGNSRGPVEAALAEAFRRVGRVEQRLSNWMPDSELSRANREAAVHAFPLSEETCWSLRKAFALSGETDGAFDPTVGGITRALGLTGEDPRPQLAARLRGSVGWQFVRLDSPDCALRFANPETSIDSGAFGKGEALDRALAALRRAGVVAARLNFGGQIALLGAETPEGHRLGFDRVAVAAPDATGRVAYRFFCPAGSVSTSGDAEKPGHLIDPRTGQAALFHGSVTVVSDTALRADALSTALFVMGPSRGIAFADRLGIPALFLSAASGSWQGLASREFLAHYSS